MKKIDHQGKETKLQERIQTKYIKRSFPATKVEEVDCNKISENMTPEEKESSQRSLAVKQNFASDIKNKVYWIGPYSRPYRTRQGSKGYDIPYPGPDEITLTPGGMIEIDTGFRFTWLENARLGAMVVGRYSLMRNGITMFSSPTVISAYSPDTLKVILRNDEQYTVVIEPGDLIAQLVFLTDERIELIEVDQYFFCRLDFIMSYIEDFKSNGHETWDDYKDRIDLYYEAYHGTDMALPKVKNHKAYFMWEDKSYFIGPMEFIMDYENNNPEYWDLG